MASIYDSLLDQQADSGAEQPPKASVYDTLLDQQEKAQKAATGIVLDQVMGKPADRAARIQELANTTRLPSDVIERNFDQVNRQDQARRLQDALTFSPVLRQQMMDPQFAAMAHDDAEPLSGIERALAPAVSTLRAIPAGLQKFATNAVYGTPELLARAGSQYLGQYLAGTVLPEDPFARVAAGFSQARKGGLAFGDQIAGAAPQGFVASSIVSGGESFGRMLPGLLTAIITKNPAYAIGAGALDAGVTSATTGLDKGLGVSQALAYGGQDAVAEAITERLPMGKLIGDLKAGAPFWKVLRNQIAAEVPTEMAATAWQNFNEWANLNPDQPFSSYLKELPAAQAQTILATVTATALTAGLASGVNRVANRAAVQEARAQNAALEAQRLEALNTLAAASQLAQRAPDSFQQFVAQATEDSPVQQVFISADALMQSGLAEDVAAMSPTVAAQLPVAAQTGGDIAIPVDEYAAKIAPTQAAGVLLDHLKTDPEGFSRAEAQAYLQGQQAEMQAEFEKATAQQSSDDAWKASADAVRTQLKSQLEATGRFTSDVNDAYATLLGSWYATKAAEFGITPEEQFQRYPLRVQAENMVGGPVLDQTSIESPAFREWFGDSKVVDADGKPLVVYHGTMADFSAFDPDRAGQNFDDPDERGMLFSSLVSEPNFMADQGDGVGGNVMPVFLSLKNPLIVDVQPSVAIRRFGVASATAWYDNNKAAILQQADAGGHDGVIVRVPAFDGAKGHATYIAFRPEQIKSVFNRGTFDAGDPNILHQSTGGPRGTFSPSTLTISLLKNADLSTFLHETGHFFLEAQLDMAAKLQQETDLTPGQRGMLADTQALLQWFGVRDLTEWYGLDFEQQRSYHEQFARGFEAYLFEGKSPNIEMQGLFQRFRAWMISVYRELKALNVQLSDDVRGVFDRMLASGEQIELAEQARSMMPLFETADQAGMTTDEFAAYQALGVQASADAIQDLQARGLRDMQWLHNARGRVLKQLQKDAAARRAEMRIEARREIMGQPVYRAWQFLTGKLSADDRLKSGNPKSDPDVLDPSQDSLLVAIAKLGGIDRAEAQSQWGVDPKGVDRPVFGKPVLRAKGGRSIDDMRQALVEHGYLERDESAPDWNPREFEDKFDAELRGDEQYSLAYDPDLAQARNMKAGEQLVAPESLGAGRLDLNEMVIEGYPDQVINVLKARRMTAKQGLHPDVVAELFGFTSGDEMIQALTSAESPRDAIDAATDVRMLERYGDLATPEAIAQAADAAIHNDARARFTATEAVALERMANPTARTGQVDRRGRPISRGTLLPAARQFARDIIARTKVRELRPGQYTNAETRAAKNADQAARQGDIQTAAAEKRNQVIQQQLARQAQAARDEVERTVRYLRGFDREGTRKNLDPDYRDQIDTLLERFDLRSGQSLKAIDRRTSLASWIEARSDEGTEPDIASWLVAEANRTHYKNLTVEQLRGLVDAVKQIEHLGRLKQKLLTTQDKRALDAIVDELRQSITENSHGPVDNERRNTLSSRTRHAMRGLLAAHRKFANLVREMDGFKDGGPLWDKVIRPMNDAGNKEASMRADATRRLNVLARPVLAEGRMGGKGTFFPSLGRSLNRGERLAIALNLGNEGNQQRLLDGRGWTAEQIKPVMDTLTAQDWQFVQGVWDFFESYRPEIAAKERRVSGVEPDWVEPVALTVRTADGQELQLRGGYYPIKYDINQSGEAGAHADAEAAKAMMKAAYTAATTRRSFTKSRAEEVRGRPLSLSFDGIYQGANEVIHDLAWHEWLIDVNRLTKRLDSAIRTGYGAQTATAIKRTIEDIAQGDKPATNAVEGALNHLRTGATVAGLGWNLYTALLQPIGATQSVARVGSAWMARGMREFYGDPLHMAAKVQEVDAQSEFMRNRARTMNREINEVQNQLSGAKHKYRTLLESSFFVLIQKTQMLVDYPTWLAAYAKAEADPANVHKDGSLDTQRVVSLADQAVIDSQGEGQIKDLAQVQRGHPAFKLFTNFYSYFSTSLNLAVDATKRANFRDPVSIAGLAGDYLLIGILPAVISGLLGYAIKGKDDDDLVEWLISEQIDYLMGMFVGLREITGGVKSALGMKNPFGYSGPAGLRFFAEMDRLGKQIGQGELDAALARSVNNTAGLLFHYPAGQVQRAVQGVSALVEGRTKNPLAPVTGYRQ